MSERFDVVVAGAGTAGAALAAFAAGAGMRVCCVDRRPLDDAGARWVNGVPRWMFREAGLAQPEGEELVGAGHDFHLFAGWGPERVTIRDHDVLDVDMRHLVARLQGAARDAGADLRGEVSVQGLTPRGLATGDGEIEARFVVDAAGMTGPRLLDQPRPRPWDICAAAQEVRVLRDRAGALAFLAEHRAAEGETLCFSSIAGGYSIVNVRVDGDRVGLLTGSVPAQGFPSGLQLLRSFADRHGWIGETIFGGSRALPLSLPHGELARGHVALLGDACSQVFSAHGSGIGLGLVAARMLADALASGAGPAGYERAFKRAWMPRLVAYDAFRRLSQRLDPPKVAWMMRAGLLTEATARSALEQRFPPGVERVTRAVARASTWLGRARP